jgi:hypothetical protein
MVTLDPAGITSDMLELAMVPVKEAVHKEDPSLKERLDTPVRTFPEPESVRVRLVTVTGPVLVMGLEKTNWRSATLEEPANVVASEGSPVPRVTLRVEAPGWGVSVVVGVNVIVGV